MPHTLLPHQQRALTYAKPRSRIALFMEMRLGKTLVAIRWAKHHKLDRILVVTPMTTIPGWIDELLGDGVPISYIHRLLGRVSEREIIAKEIDTGWALINYEGIQRAPDLLKLPWSGIILDESTRIRKPQAQVTKFSLNRTRHIAYRAILTGLPAPESPLDYWCQMAFVEGDFLDCRNYWLYRDRYFFCNAQGWDWRPKTGTLEAIKRALHRSAFVMSRKGAGIGERKIYETRTVAMTSEQRKSYREVLKHFKFEDLETKWATTRELWLARVAGGFSPDQEHPRLISDTKLMELKNLLLTELAGESVVVWFRFNEELHAAAAVLAEQQVTYRCIEGATPLDERAASVRAFQAGDVRVMLIQIKCGRFGLALHRASTAIYYSNSYELEDRKQSEDRIVSVQKSEPLLYVDLVTEGTVDVAVAEVLKEKNVSAKHVLNRIVAQVRQNWESHHVRSVTGAAPTPIYVQAARTRVNRVFPAPHANQSSD